MVLVLHNSSLIGEDFSGFEIELNLFKRFFGLIVILSLIV